MAPRQISFKALIYPNPKGQITLHLLRSQTWGDFSVGHSPTAAIPTMQQEQQFQKAHISAPHPATAAAPAAIWPINAPIATHTMTHPTWHRGTLSHTHHFSHRCHLCHYSMDWNCSSLQQLLLHCTGNTAKKSQATPKTFNLP